MLSIILLLFLTIMSTSMPTILTIITSTYLDSVHFGVTPIDGALLKIKSYLVGPADIGVHQRFPSTSVHVGSSNARLISPVGPVHETGPRVQSQTARDV